MMSNSVDELMQQVIKAGKSGDKAAAKNYLAQIVKIDPQNARAWYMLSQVVDRKEQAVYCLRKTLEIDPGNQRAAARLQKLQQAPAANIAVPKQPPQSATPPTQAKVIQKKKRNPCVTILAAFSGFVLLCICCSSLAYTLTNNWGTEQIVSNEPTVGSMDANLPPAVLAPTDTVFPTFTPTDTSIPTDIAPLAPTNTPDPSKPVPGNAPTCISPNAQMDIALVTNVVDGDTIDVLLNGQTYRVRYIGIDTPETVHPDKPVESLGPEAAAKNAELVSGKDVVLVKDVSETDKYGRLLRYVFVGDLSGIFVNYELVRRGYAVASTYPPDVACAETFLFAQNLATNEQIGLWAPLPVPSLTPITRFAPATQPSQGGPCNCSGPDLNCNIEDFSTHAQAQACYDYCVSQGFGDVFGLDGNDKDGIACENLP